MSTKNKQIYSKLTHINQEEQPCLRTLRRKIRNYNKKLQDIKETQGKDFLRPEQLEKINRKQKYQAERDKCVDFTVVYRQILLENEEYYRSQQLKQIDDLSMILSVMQSENFRKKVEGSGNNFVFKGSQKFQKDTMSLKQMYESIKKMLTDVANCVEIKEMAKKYLEQNSEQMIYTVPKLLDWGKRKIIEENEEFTQKKTEQIVYDSTNIDEKQQNNEAKYQIKVNENVQEVSKVNQIQKIKAQDISQDHSRDVVEEYDQSQDQRVSRQKSEIIVHSKDYQNSQKPTQRESDKKGTFKSADKIQEQKNVRTNRNQGNNVKFNRYKRSNSKEKRPEKGRNKYRNDKQHTNRAQVQGNSSQNSDNPPKFNQQQIKQLEDDGFIVVGKPKIKKNVYSQHSGNPRRGNRHNNY